MKKIGTTQAKKTVKAATKAASKATVKDIGGGCAAVTLTGELGEMAARVARVAGVSPDEAIRQALKGYFEAMEAKDGKRAVYIPEAAYRHLEQIADALNRDTWGGQDNSPQTVFEAFILDRDLADDPATTMEGILEGLDYLPEKSNERTALHIEWLKKNHGAGEYKENPEHEKVMRSRQSALTRRAAKIKWA